MRTLLLLRHLVWVWLVWAAGGDGAAYSYEGFGVMSKGGAGGDRYHVTSLADSGAGTLRDGILNRTGPRSIVFDVGGTITLLSDVYIQKPYLSIDGSTAPAPGITIQKPNIFDGEFGIAGTHDIIISHLRFSDQWAPGLSEGNNNSSTIGIDGDTNPDHVVSNVILDHLTVHGAPDGALGLWGAVHDVTVSWCLVYRSSKTTVVSFENDTQARKNISWHHNLYIENIERQPQIRGDVDTFDCVNNVIYGYGWSDPPSGYGIRVRTDRGVVSANIIGNYFIPTVSGLANAIVYDGSGPYPFGSIYTFGNQAPSGTIAGLSTVSSPLSIPAYARVTAWPAHELKTRLLPYAGMKYRNATETSLVNQVSAAMPSPPASRRADFDGDGKADLLFRYPSNGEVYLWLMR